MWPIWLTCGMFIYVLSISCGVAQGNYWQAPERGAKVAALIPGRKIPPLNKENLYADWCQQQVERWNKTHPPLSSEEAFARYAATAPTDEELTRDFPRHIVPFARVRSGAVDPAKAEQALFKYCPLCGSWSFGLTYDPNNCYHATTTCCRRELWGRKEDMPPDYPLRPTEKVSFQHLDGTMYEDEAAIFTDKEGVIWELFIRTRLDYQRWLEQGCDLVRRFGQAFVETADPLYVHKIAIVLDKVADTYYGLPLAAYNRLATLEGKPLTREAWLKVPQPGIFELTPLGAWGRRMPFSSPGWLNMMDEHIWVEPFARVRHHPHFKAVSQKLYGDPEALERKIREKLIGDLVLMFKTAFSQKLLTNYQEANYVDLWLLGILADDKTLIDFAGPAQEVTLYNHTYYDGLNGEGAPNYMAMPGGYFYPFLADPKGWLQYYPDFLQDHPFYYAAAQEMRKLTTVRGLSVEFGDQHQHVFPSLQTDPQKVAAAEKIGSRNWAGYGVGIIRVGGAGHRLELCLTDSRASLHNAQDALGLECWLDGVPLLRRGGYAAYWCNARLQWERPEFQALRQMKYPKEIAEGGWPPDNWSWNYAHSPLCQNNMTIDEMGTGPGWDDNRGYGETLTFKGGETAGTPGSGFQILDVRDHFSWARRNKNIQEFRRTIIGVEGPEGRPYAVDVLTCRGEGRQALYYSVFGDPIQEQMPRVLGEAQTLKEYYFGGKKTEDTPENQAFAHVRHVKKLAPPQQPWSVTWEMDLGLYGPRDPGGKPYQRPWPEGVGAARLRVIGLPPGTDSRVELLRAKGPWIGWLRQPLPAGQRVDGNVAFLEARDFVIERRLPANGAADASRVLEELYIRILEGFRQHETSVIQSVQRLPAQNITGPQRDIVALKLEFADGHTDIVIYQSERGECQCGDGIQTDARYALVRKDGAGQIVGCEICRGTYLRAGEYGVTLPGDFTGEIVDVVGDLTGTRRESALIIKPDKPWPLGTALQNRQLQIRIESPLRPPCEEGYRIDKVTPLSGGLIRVDMQDYAPFVMSWHEVTELPAERPNVIKTWRPMVDYGNSPYYQGLKLWFPERNKLYTIKQVNRVGGGYGGDTVELLEPVNLAAEGIKVGDWYVIYGVQPGLKVHVANDFCFRRESSAIGQLYTATGPGDFTIRSPLAARALYMRIGRGPWQLAPRGQTQLSFPAEKTQGQSVYLLAEKPDWLNLEDEQAPQIAIKLDGKPVAVENQEAKLGWIEAPKLLEAEIRDEANPLDTKRLCVRLNGQPAPAAALTITPVDEGRGLRLSLHLPQALAADTHIRKHQLEIAISDQAVEPHEARVVLSFMIRPPLEADAVYLSDLKPVRAFAHGGLIRDTDYLGNPAQIGEIVYPKCLTMHPESGPEGEYAEAVYELPPGQQEWLLQADIGVSNSAGGAGSVEFVVQVAEAPLGPWRTLYRSPVLRGGQAPLVIKVALGEAKFLRLYTTSAGDGIGSDHALWGNVRLTPKK